MLYNEAKAMHKAQGHAEDVMRENVKGLRSCTRYVAYYTTSIRKLYMFYRELKVHAEGMWIRGHAKVRSVRHHPRRLRTYYSRLKTMQKMQCM